MVIATRKKMAPSSDKLVLLVNHLPRRCHVHELGQKLKDHAQHVAGAAGRDPMNIWRGTWTRMRAAQSCPPAGPGGSWPGLCADHLGDMSALSAGVSTGSTDHRGGAASGCVHGAVAEILDLGGGRRGDWDYFSVAGLRFPPFFDRPETSLLRAKPRWNGPATPPP